MNLCAKDPTGGRVAGTEDGQSGRGRGRAAKVGRDPGAWAHGVQGRWAPEMRGRAAWGPWRRSPSLAPAPTPLGAAVAAEPRKRAGISCARPARARRAAVSACRWLHGRRLRGSEGRGEGQAAAGREAPGRRPSRPTVVSGAGRRESRLEGGTPGFPGR